MHPNFIRHLLRRVARTCVRASAPRLERLVNRVYCSRLNGVVTWMMAGTEELEFGGATMQIDPSEFIGYSAFFFGGGDNAEVRRLADVCGNAHLFADIGANIGLISLPLAAQLPRLEIIAFEPDARNRRMLATNLALNPALAGRVKIEASAAGKSNTTAQFLSDRGNFGRGHLVDAASDQTCIVNVVRLDEFFAKAGRFPEVIKIDVEGAELAVLEGMTGLLNDRPPRAILVEVHAFSADDPWQFKKAIKKILTTAGYRLYYPFNQESPDTPWDDIAAWPDHCSLLALQSTAAG